VKSRIWTWRWNRPEQTHSSKPAPKSLAARGAKAASRRAAAGIQHGKNVSSLASPGNRKPHVRHRGRAGLHRSGAGKQSQDRDRTSESHCTEGHPGKITDEELERERGGSGLRYSFDIKHSSSTQEVGVDAQTGKVLENKKEGPNPD
jgi:hypothetical protein